MIALEGKYINVVLNSKPRTEGAWPAQLPQRWCATQP